MSKFGPKSSKICKRGHDKDIVGKYKDGSCKECKRMGEKRRYKSHPLPKKPFCIHGHEIVVVGRDKDGHCRGCRKILRNKRYFKNREKEITYSVKYAKMHRKQLNRAARILMNNHPERRTKYRLKNNFGITVAQYEKMLEEQEYKCAICKINREDLIGYKRLVVDHNHLTNEIRGLLCDPCNRGLGQFRDNLKFLKNAIKYLRSHSKKGTK